MLLRNHLVTVERILPSASYKRFLVFDGVERDSAIFLLKYRERLEKRLKKLAIRFSCVNGFEIERIGLNNERIKLQGFCLICVWKHLFFTALAAPSYPWSRQFSSRGSATCSVSGMFSDNPRPVISSVISK